MANKAILSQQIRTKRYKDDERDIECYSFPTIEALDKIATEIEKARPKALMTSYSLKGLNEAGFIQAHIKYKELQIELLDLQYIKRTNPRKGGEVALQIALKKEQLELKALEIKNYLYYIRLFR